MKAPRNLNPVLIARFALACFAPATTASVPELLLDPLFQDHAVLQRGEPLRLWGRARAGDEITVSFAGATSTARADATERWMATLPALEAGGPHSLRVQTSSGTTQILQDILIGDVWLCSGQSNMALGVKYTLDAWAEVAKSSNDSIRLMTVAQTISPVPIKSFKTSVRWQPATPATVGEFSATCFYFARELQTTIRVPMGLVNASWGGSRIEEWMSEHALRTTGRYDAQLDLLRTYATDPDAAARGWGEMWQAWWQRRAHGAPWSARAVRRGKWRPAPDSLGPWESWGVPELAKFDGMVWHRTTVRLSAKQAKQPAILSLGRVDEVDQTWVNGEPVGGSLHANLERRYGLRPGLLRAGENVIVVNALDHRGTGGLIDPSEARALHLADGTSVPLDGNWLFQVGPANPVSAPRPPWEPGSTMTMLHNAMIAPLGAYVFRGVVWYQGESNTDHPASYEMLLKGLMRDWRAQFGGDLPFLLVQLANHGPSSIAPVESGWAGVREAQRRVVVDDAHSALVVTIDIGDRYDIHPPNKQEVGRRLARAARHLIYGEPVAPSGPAPCRARREDDTVIVDFVDVETRLVAYNSANPIGFELCEARPAPCQYATATIRGNSVAMNVPSGSNPMRVRFCWADSPVCTLYDAGGLPAGPFELSIY